MVCNLALLIPGQTNSSQSVLVVRGGALGDFVLTLPTILALRARFRRVEVLANRQFAELEPPGRRYSLDDADLAVFFSRNSALPAKWRDYFRQIEVIISYLYDPEGVFEENVRSCGVRDFIAGPHQIRPGAHATNQLAAPLQHLGIPLTDCEPKLDITDAEKAACRAKFKDDYSITIHPGSGSPRKNWPLANWIELIDMILAHRKRVVVVGGEADGKQILRLRARFGERIGYAVNWPLRQLAGILSDTTFAGHDSGVSHLAAAVGAHSVILFGPTDPLVWAPRNRNARIIVAPDADLARLDVNTVSSELDLTRPLQRELRS